jgi:zinc protease
MTVDDVKEWYQEWYVPNNALLVVVGDVDPKLSYQLASRYFAKIPYKKVAKQRLQDEPPSLGERDVVVNAPAKLPWLIFGYNVPSFKTASPLQQAYALCVLAYVLDGNDSSRLEKDLVRDRQIASEIGAGYNPVALYSQEFMFAGTPAKGYTVADLKKAMLQEIDDLKNKPLTAAELKRVKTALLAEHTFSKDSLMDQAQEIATLEAVGLSWHMIDTYATQINQVSAAQVQEVAKQYFNDDNLTVAILNPLPLSGPEKSYHPNLEGDNDVQ